MVVVVCSKLCVTGLYGTVECKTDISKSLQPGEIIFSCKSSETLVQRVRLITLKFH